MLKPELSRLKGAPSLCSVGHRKGRAMDEPRQQATVKQEKTMLTPELSRLKRLKGAPSTCVCSDGKEGSWRTFDGAKHETKPDTCKSFKIPISA